MQGCTVIDNLCQNWCDGVGEFGEGGKGSFDELCDGFGKFDVVAVEHLLIFDWIACV